MSKLEEIKQLFADYQSEDMETRLKSMRIIQTRYYEDILYLLSLIEEKDKALAFYVKEEAWNMPGVYRGEVARKALRGE